MWVVTGWRGREDGCGLLVVVSMFGCVCSCCVFNVFGGSEEEEREGLAECLATHSHSLTHTLTHTHIPPLLACSLAHSLMPLTPSLTHSLTQELTLIRWPIKAMFTSNTALTGHRTLTIPLLIHTQFLEKSLFPKYIAYQYKSLRMFRIISCHHAPREKSVRLNFPKSCHTLFLA